MTNIIEGMTPTEFENAINDNFDSLGFTHTAISSNTDLQANLNAYFSKSDNYIGIKGINYASLINSNFATKYKSIFDRAFINTLSDFAILPLNIPSPHYRNGKTYLTFQSFDDDPYIITYTHLTDTWSAPVKVGVNPLGNGDGHGPPSMWFDSQGYVHVFWGSHGGDVQHAKSALPEDITTWIPKTSPIYASYPEVAIFSDGTIWVFGRITGGLWGYVKSTDDGETWAEEVNIFANISYCMFKKGIGDTIHCTALGSPPTTDVDRYNVYYMFYDGVHWKDINGNILTLTITDPSLILAYDSGDEFTPWSQVVFDSANKPYMITEQGTGVIGTYIYKFIKHKDDGWHSYDLGVGTDNWRDVPTALDCISSTHFDAYVVTGGTAGARGGRIEKWSSFDGGETWSKIQTLADDKQYIDPMIVENYNVNAKLIFVEQKALGTYDNVGCLWGEGGFVGKRIDN